jgi:photosystem II stability/assembly factor-like uncharacterized protein
MTNACLPRRRVLAAAAMLAVGRAGAADATDPAAGRFAALQRPALKVRQPDKAVLQAAAVAGRRVVAVGERGIVALSDDGARTWRQARGVPVSGTLTAVRFLDDRRGWAVGHGGVVLATRDGGEEWQLLADGRRLAALAEQSAQQQPERPALAKEAAVLVADGPDKPLLDLHVSGDGRLFVVGAYNLAFDSSDAGAHWTAALSRIDNPKSQHLYALAVRGQTWLIAGEQGLLMQSRDGGQSFRRLTSPYAGSWFAVSAAGDRQWVVAGLRGHAYRSSDDGESWLPLEGAPPASFVSATPLPDGRVLLANQAGQLFTTHDGPGLVRLAAPSLPPLTQAIALPGGDLLALSMAGALRLPGNPS